MNQQRLDDELDALWVGLQDELVDAPVRRRRRRGIAVAGVVGVSVALGGAAAAHEFLYEHARTGQVSEGWEEKASGPGEFLELSAADTPAVLRELTTDIPFAPGYEAYREFLYDVWMPSDQQVMQTTSAARAELAVHALCTWGDAWVAADRAGDRSARDEATRTIEQAQQWEAVKVFPERGDGSPFQDLPALEKAVGSGDADDVAAALVHDGGTYCVTEQLRAIDGDRLLRETVR